MNNFDVVFSNPPYGNDKDLNIVLKLLKHSNKQVVVMTASFLIDVDKTSIRNTLNKYCEQIKLFNGNKVFGIDFYYPLCIVVLDKSKTEKNILIDDENYSMTKYRIEDLNKFSRLGKLSDEVLENEKQVEKNLARQIHYYDKVRTITSDDCGKFILRISKGISGVHKKSRVIDIVIPKGQKNIAKVELNKQIDFYIPPSKKNHKFPATGFDTVFDTFEEADTVANTYKQPIIRYFIQKEKIGHNITRELLKRLPWPADEKGKIKYLTGEELKKKLGMYDELYNMILKYYSLEHNKNYKEIK